MRFHLTDFATDVAIQKALRTEFDKETTFITVAHRLQTIMDYDKIVRERHLISSDTLTSFALDGA